MGRLWKQDPRRNHYLFQEKIKGDYSSSNTAEKLDKGGNKAKEIK